jgi:hypothetical protein
VWQTLGPWLGTGGILSFVSALLWQVRSSYNTAIATAERRADMGWAAYDKLWDAYLLREQQLVALMSRETTKRETG